MGHEPGAPDIHESWYVSGVPGEGKGSAGYSSATEAALAIPNTDRFYVGNGAFTSWFHERGYYSVAGGSRPKWMLRDAVAATQGALGIL